MKNKKLIAALWIAFYIAGSVCSYNSAKKVFTAINTEFDHGQPKFSKENQIVSFTISITSWIGWFSCELWYGMAYNNLLLNPLFCQTCVMRSAFIDVKLKK